MAIKVLLAEDHEIVRQGIKALLESESKIEIVGEAANGAEALLKLAGLKPEVVVMDMNMPVMNGLECTKKIKELYPEIKILILSMHDHENYLIDMLEAGADGYALKNASREELVFAISKIANDSMYIGHEFTLNMLAKYKSEKGSRPVADPLPVSISAREKEVLDLIAQGFTNMEIANKLFTSVRTIETRRKKLLEKTGTTNTATLIRFAVLNGMVS